MYVLENVGNYMFVRYFFRSGPDFARNAAEKMRPNMVCLRFFPECVAKGSRLTLEVWRLKPCSPSCFHVRKRPQPSVTRPHWGPFRA